MKSQFFENLQHPFTIRNRGIGKNRRIAVELPSPLDGPMNKKKKRGGGKRKKTRFSRAWKKGINMKTAEGWQ